MGGLVKCSHLLLKQKILKKVKWLSTYDQREGRWYHASLRLGSESSCRGRYVQGPPRSESVWDLLDGAEILHPSRSPSMRLTRHCSGSRTAW